MEFSGLFSAGPYNTLNPFIKTSIITKLMYVLLYTISYKVFYMVSTVCIICFITYIDTGSIIGPTIL